MSARPPRGNTTGRTKECNPGVIIFVPPIFCGFAKIVFSLLNIDVALLKLYYWRTVTTWRYNCDAEARPLRPKAATFFRKSMLLQSPWFQNHWNSNGKACFLRFPMLENHSFYMNKYTCAKPKPSISVEILRGSMLLKIPWH